MREFEFREKRTEVETVSTVKSNISDASSGFAIVSHQVPVRRTKTRDPIPPFAPPEPQPDYDVHYCAKAPLDDSLDSEKPLLTPPYTPLDKIVSGDSVESRQPLLSVSRSTSSEQSHQRKTHVQIQSPDTHVSIEVTETPTSRSPGSTTGDSSFLYRRNDSSINNRTPKRKNKICMCGCSKREKCMCISLVIVVLVCVVVIIGVILNFTVCIADVTSAC